MKGFALNKMAVFFAIGVFLSLSLNGWILLQVLQLHSEVLKAQASREKSRQISAEIEQETAALSRMVRAYTTSADSRYLTYYYDIIDIRQGNKAAPQDYGATYWAEVMAGARLHAMPVKTAGISLMERMRAQGFSKEEFVLLDKILADSQSLFLLDQIAFAATQGLYDPDKMAYTDEGRPEPQFANKLVYSDKYLNLENNLAQDVQKFIHLADNRTQKAVAAVSSQLRESITFAIIILAGTVIFVLLAMVFIRQKVLAPIWDLSRKAIRLGAGDYSVRADIGEGALELQALGRTFNSMAHNIEEDICHRQQVQKELEIARASAEESTKAKSLFLANMSHEIRTPMNAIIGMTYLAFTTELSQRQRDYIGKIQTAAQSLLGVINDILDFTKIEAGKLMLESVACKLEDIVDNALNLIRAGAEEKGISLLLDIESHSLLGDDGCFWGDPLRLEQIMTNLLSNAIKFTDNGFVRLTLREIVQTNGNTELQVEIEDTGIGMTELEQRKLFQEFSQVDASTTRRHGGTGLGLAITKKLLALMGGEISVTSLRGKGTVFTCTLPIVKEGGKKSSREQENHQIISKQALVLDSSPKALDILKRLLRYFGVEAQPVTTGEALLQLLRDSDMFIDYLFIDSASLDIDLKDLADVIALSPPQKTPCVVMMAASEQDVDGLEFRQGSYITITKPVLPNDVRRLIINEEHCPSADAQDSCEPSHQRFEGMRVLLVEDNPVNQEIAVEMLSYHGVDVEVADNGRHAIDMIQEKADDYYHAVLMDIQMPEMDGYEATRILRGDKRYAELPIIAMTAHAMIDEKERCLEMGMNTHVAKPINIEHLMQSLRPYCPATHEPVHSIGLGPEPATQVGRAQWIGDIPGIDLEKGMKHCAGNAEFYRKVLAGYLREFSTLPDRLMTFYTRQQQQEFQAVIHSFKGLSATIGATELQEIGRRIEENSDDSMVTVSGLIDTLAMKLKPLLINIEKVLPPVHAGESMTSIPHETEATSEHLVSRLIALLEEADSEAQELWHSQEQVFRKLLPSAIGKKVATAIGRFQFAEACEMLSSVVERE